MEKLTGLIVNATIVNGCVWGTCVYHRTDVPGRVWSIKTSEIVRTPVMLSDGWAIVKTKNSLYAVIWATPDQGEGVA